MIYINPYSRNYFFGLSLFMLILGFIAFADNMIFDINQESNGDPKFMIHGLLMYAWIIVLNIQTNYIRKSNVKAHVAFGKIGFLLGLLMIISTTYLYFVIAVPWNDLPFFGKANRIFLPTFFVMFVLAYMIVF